MNTFNKEIYMDSFALGEIIVKAKLALHPERNLVIALIPVIVRAESGASSRLAIYSGIREITFEGNEIIHVRHFIFKDMEAIMELNMITGIEATTTTKEGQALFLNSIRDAFLNYAEECDKLLKKRK